MADEVASTQERCRGHRRFRFTDEEDPHRCSVARPAGIGQSLVSPKAQVSRNVIALAFLHHCL
jgi:hypothetical protein